MKELKKRIKGLSAILLAMSLALCLVVRFSGVSVSAEIKDSIKIYTSTYERANLYTLQDAIDKKIITKELSVSGGALVIEKGSDSITDNIAYGPIKEEGYYMYATIKNSSYDGFMITGARNVNDLYYFTVQFVKQPSTVGDVGVGTYYMTPGRPYSFPSGSTHKVQGDPTVYYGTSFYVSSSGTYTIEQ